MNTPDPQIYLGLVVGIWAFLGLVLHHLPYLTLFLSLFVSKIFFGNFTIQIWGRQNDSIRPWANPKWIWVIDLSYYYFNITIYIHVYNIIILLVLLINSFGYQYYIIFLIEKLTVELVDLIHSLTWYQLGKVQMLAEQSPSTIHYLYRRRHRIGRHWLSYWSQTI